MNSATLKRSSTEQERTFARYNWYSTATAAAMLGGVDSEQVIAWVDAGLLTAFDASKEDAKRRDLRFKPEWIEQFEATRTLNKQNGN